jgi:signal peptidase I
MKTTNVRPHRSHRLGIALAWVAGLILAALVVLRLFVFHPFRIPSDSMYPTVPSGSLVIVDKRGFSSFPFIHSSKRAPTAKIRRGDVVISEVFEDGTMYLQRVIGLPGERVRVQGRQVTINDAPIPVEVIPGPLITRDRLQLQHAFETIDERQITIAWIPARPSPNFDGVVPEGHYFMLGDNRDNARDSRFAEVGFVAAEKIRGRVVNLRE